MNARIRAIAVIDGEHYAPVLRDAIAGLPYDVVGALLVGGTEKLRDDADYGVPVVETLTDVDADVVVDISDEPVLGPRDRLRLASRALALGLPYVGGDFRFEPPRYHAFELPSVAIIGAGKRVGKTAVTAHVARLLARERAVVVVSMGRGGPAEPDVVTSPPTVEDLLERSRAGAHAASDFLETALLAEVPTVGCRRAGAGLAGQVLESNVAAGAEAAVALDPDVVVFDSSGAAIPPVAVDARILVASPQHDLDDYLNPYRVLVSDLVVLLGDARPPVIKELPIVRARLQLRPTAPLEGRVAVFTTGAAVVDELDCDVVHVSRSLADRRALRDELARVEADTFLIELKAAAIDVVAEEAMRRGASVVVAGYDVIPVDGDLDAEILRLVPSEVAAV